MTDSAHIPVLLERCLQLLDPALERPGAVVVDGTLGLGGHSAALLARHPQLRLVGVDRDAAALALAGERLAPYAGRFELVHATYDQLPHVLGGLGIEAVAGILLDLGVSSMQLDSDERGFAYSRDTPLDMRMDPSTGVTAEEVLASASGKELARIFRQYGEERFASRIADRIVTYREHTALTSTAQLVEVVREGVPAAARRTGGNPAKRVFQALRIAVNAELDGLNAVMPAALARLAVEGRIVVLAYHSLEDRIVKRALSAAAASGLPAGLPVPASEIRPEFELLLRGAEQAGPDEIARNPRAASVRLRAAVRRREAT